MDTFLVDTDSKKPWIFVSLFQEQKKELTAENIMLWEKITELSSRGILKIVDFAKKIPGFLTLPTSDQITLLKAACLEIMVGTFDGYSGVKLG